MQSTNQNAWPLWKRNSLQETREATDTKGLYCYCVTNITKCVERATQGGGTIIFITATLPSGLSLTVH